MDFQKDVIERSHRIPVLVDFWAEWCGPCRMLTPVLEAVAAEQPERWELVKVNTEEHQALAAKYGIRSIPNCKLFFGGEVVDEFVGALTRPMLEKWLDEHIPDASVAALSQILASGKGWPDASLLPALEQYLLEHPGKAEAQFALASHLLATDVSAAVELAGRIPPGHKRYEDAQAIAVLGELLGMAAQAGAEGVEAQLSEAAEAIRRADAAGALQALIRAVGTDKAFKDGLPRRATIAVFRMLGESHPLTREYRRKFSMAMY